MVLKSWARRQRSAVACLTGLMTMLISLLVDPTNAEFYGQRPDK